VEGHEEGHLKRQQLALAVVGHGQPAGDAVAPYVNRLAEADVPLVGVHVGRGPAPVGIRDP